MKKQILLVNDQDNFSDSLRIALKRSGMELVCDDVDYIGSAQNLHKKYDFCDLIIFNTARLNQKTIHAIKHMVLDNLQTPIIIIVDESETNFLFLNDDTSNLRVITRPFDHKTLIHAITLLTQ